MAEAIGIVGAGRMGTGIAQVCLQAGYKVVLLDVTSKFLMAARQTIEKAIEEGLSTGKAPRNEKSELMARLVTGMDFSLLSGCSVCIETVLEHEGIKSFLLSKILGKTGGDTIIASNTASLSVKALSKRIGFAPNFAGITFGFPPQSSPQVKVIPGPKTGKDIIEKLTKFITSLGKESLLIEDRKESSRIPLQTQVWGFFSVMVLLFVACAAPAWLSLAPQESFYVSLLPALGGIFTAGVFSVMVASQFKRLNSIRDSLVALAANELTTAIPFLDRKDEFGDISRTIEVLKKITIEADRLAEEEAKKRQADMERKAMLEKITRDFELSVGHIVEDLAEESSLLQKSAKHLSEMADKTSRQSTTVASAGEEASASVQTVASAAEELSASIGEINRQVSESSRVSLEAVQEVKRTDSTVSTLSEAAAQIGDVVKLIQDIAEQTNLLALNATIEAARAGEAGKGFAVVASEVKNLANQTARATEEISNKIITVQNVSTEAANAIRGIGATIERINEISRTISEAVQQQTTATREISNSVQQAYLGISEVSQNIATVTQMAGESSNASQDVLQASGKLSQQAGKLRIDVHDFLNKVK